jgi:metallopeptidase MepB
MIHIVFFLTGDSAQVFAADLFESTFAADPRCQLAWERYRRGVLEYGGSRDELQMLHEFLGRPPNPYALLRSLLPRKVG